MRAHLQAKVDRITAKAEIANDEIQALQLSLHESQELHSSAQVSTAQAKALLEETEQQSQKAATEHAAEAEIQKAAIEEARIRSEHANANVERVEKKRADAIAAQSLAEQERMEAKEQVEMLKAKVSTAHNQIDSLLDTLAVANAETLLHSDVQQALHIAEAKLPEAEDSGDAAAIERWTAFLQAARDKRDQEERTVAEADDEAANYKALQAKLMIANENVSALQTEHMSVSEAQAETEDLKAKLMIANESMSVLQTEHKSMLQAQAETEDQLKDVHEKLEASTKRCEKLAEKTRMMQGDLVEASEEIEVQQGRLEQMESELAVAAATLEQTMQECEQLRKESSNVDVVLKRVKQMQTQVAEGKAAEVKAEVAEAKAQAAEAKAEEASELLRSQASNVNECIQALQQGQSQMATKLRSIEKINASLEEERDEADMKANELLDLLANEGKEVEFTVQQVKAAQQEVGRLEEMNEKLKVKLAESNENTLKLQMQQLNIGTDGIIEGIEAKLEAKLRDATKAFNKELEEMSRQKDEAQANSDEAQAERDEAQAERDASKEGHQRLKGKMQVLYKDMDELLVQVRAGLGEGVMPSSALGGTEAQAMAQARTLWRCDIYPSDPPTFLAEWTNCTNWANARCAGGGRADPGRAAAPGHGGGKGRGGKCKEGKS